MSTFTSASTVIGELDAEPVAETSEGPPDGTEDSFVRSAYEFFAGLIFP